MEVSSFTKIIEQGKGIPSVIVDLITVPGGIDDVQSKTYTVFLDDLSWIVSNFPGSLDYYD